MIIALEVWGSDFDQVLSTCRRAEELGFHAFYYGESPHGLNLDCWTTLAALARSTSRIRLGPVITNILPDYRSTALLARQAATVARISGGRVDFRTGVGASARFGRAWWDRAGVVYPNYDRRLADLTVALDALASHWDPRHGPDPAAAVPPVTIAATGRRAMELAAVHATVWETSFCTPSEAADRISRMTALTGDRRLACSLEIDGFLAPTPDGLDRLLDRVRSDRAGEDLDPVLERALIGGPDEAADRIHTLAAVGVDQLVVALHDPHDPEALEVLAAAAGLQRRRPDGTPDPATDL